MLAAHVEIDNTTDQIWEVLCKASGTMACHTSCAAAVSGLTRG